MLPTSAEHDTAPRLAAREVSDGVGEGLEGENAVDGHLKAGTLRRAGQALQTDGAGDAEDGHEPRARPGRQAAGLAGQEGQQRAQEPRRAQAGRPEGLGGGRDMQRGDDAPSTDDTERPGQRVAPDGVEHEVQLAGGVLEAGFPVVDGVRRAERTGSIEVARADRGVDLGAALMRELHR